MNSTLELESSHLALRDLGPWLRDLLEGVDDDTIGGIELAIHELATNSVDHADADDKRLELSASRTDDEFRVVMTDRGRPVEMHDIDRPDPDVPQVRGYGLMIIEQLSTGLDYERTDDQNRWTVTFDLTA